MTLNEIEQLLGAEAQTLLEHQCKGIPREMLHLPGPDFVDRVFVPTDRKIGVLRNMQPLFDHGNLAHSGYLSILPVDQGIEHSAGASFAPNPIYFDPENIVKLAIEGGCNAVASTLRRTRVRARGSTPTGSRSSSRSTTTSSCPTQHLRPDHVRRHRSGRSRWAAAAVGATIYFGSEESKRQIQEVSEAFKYAHELGMATILWCYTRNAAFKTQEKDYHVSADLTGQANHLGVTIEADIIKQKLPENNGGYTALNFGKTHKKVYSELTTDHPIDLTRYQVANCYMGRMGLINSGGASGQNDLAEAVRTAVINKRAGGMGLISGRKAFQKPMKEGVQLLNAIQEVYLNKEVTIA